MGNSKSAAKKLLNRSEVDQKKIGIINVPNYNLITKKRNWCYAISVYQCLYYIDEFRAKMASTSSENVF